MKVPTLSCHERFYARFEGFESDLIGLCQHTKRKPKFRVDPFFLKLEKILQEEYNVRSLDEISDARINVIFKDSDNLINKLID